LELVESGSKDLRRFLECAQLMSRQPGGRREAGVLLGLLEDALQGSERYRELITIYGKMAELAPPDDGQLREKVIATATKAYPDRPDLEGLLEHSGLRGGPVADLSKQCESLERLLQIEKDAYVFHKSGWGVGKIVEYYPERGRCVIDFCDRPGHEMDVDAAARILERLPEDDIRVRGMVDRRGLRSFAKEEPLKVLQQVLGWYGNAANLRNVRGALTAEAVAPTTWSTWWKSAKKAALLDPRFEVGSGRDPRIEIHEVAQADFRSQIEMALKRSATVTARQKVVSDYASTVGANEEARATLIEVVERELERTAKAPSARMGWEAVAADLRGEDPSQRLGDILALSNDPIEIVKSISDDRIRASAAAGYLHTKEDGLPDLLLIALEEDDPICGEAFVAGAKKQGRDDLLSELLDKIDAKPALMPALYAWYLRGLRRDKWEGREHEPNRLVTRVLKVLDAVEYRQRRGGVTKDKKAVVQLGDVLAEKSCALVKEASAATDEEGARHLIQLVSSARGLRNVDVGRMQSAVLASHPGAAGKAQREEEPEAPEDAARIYMTTGGIDSLKAHRQTLENDEMPANRAEIARAREFGDLKENAEYHAAREKQGLLQAKLDQLKSDIARAVPITSDMVSSDSVSVGTRVRLKDGDHELTYTLFGPPDMDMDKGIINYMTPLGQALMGTKVGDAVRLDVEGAVRELEVLGIENGLNS